MVMKQSLGADMVFKVKDTVTKYAAFGMNAVPSSCICMCLLTR